MKKTLTLLIVILLLLNVCFAAETMPTLQGNSVSVKAGETVDFVVSVTNNPGLSGFRIFLEYDTSVISVEKNDDESIQVVGGIVSGKGTMFSNTTDSGCQVLWGASETVDSDGTLFTVRLRVADNANGSYPIVISYLAMDTVGSNGESVNFETVFGSISVEGKTIIKLGQAAGFAGDTVLVPVEIERNRGFAGVNLTFTYDTDKLELISITKGELLANVGSFTRNVSAGTVMWYDSANITGDGVLFYLGFRLIETEELGDGFISAGLTGGSGKNFVNASGTAVDVLFETGSVVFRTGALEVNKAILEQDGTVMLELTDAPKTKVTVIVATYDGNQMEAVYMYTGILDRGSNAVDVAIGTNHDSAKIFFIDPETNIPLHRTVVLG